MTDLESLLSRAEELQSEVEDEYRNPTADRTAEMFVELIRTYVEENEE